MPSQDSPDSCYQYAVPGFYAVNRRTNIAVDGPLGTLQQAQAQATAEARNAIEPETPGLVIAVEVPHAS